MEKQLAEISAQMKRINEAMEDIEREAGLNTEGVFSDKQRESYKALKEQWDSLEQEQKQLEEQRDLMKSRSQRQDSLKPDFMRRRSQANSGAPLTQVSGQPIEGQQNGEQNSPRFCIPRAVKRTTPANFRGELDGYKADERAYRFGMWALATLSNQIPGHYNFEHAKQFVRDYMNTAHGESDATTGGSYLVPEEFSRDLIVLRENYGVARRLFGMATMSSDTLNIPKRSGGLTASFTAESSAISESNMTWSNIQLVAKKLTALSRMSAELNADAVISVGDTLAGEIAYAFANKEDDCAFNGDGTSTYGGIQGVATLLTSIDGGGTDSKGLNVAASATTWATLALSDFNATVALLPQYADNGDACWVAHRAFYYGVMQRLETAAGGNTLFEIANGDRRARPLFLGYPVEISQVMVAATATATVSALLGNFKQGAIFGDRNQTAIAFSEHATINSENVFERNQIAIRGTERMDIVVHGCGSSTVVGPIVGLATHA